MATDPVADYLRTVNTSNRARAAAWDAVHASSDDDAKARLQQLPFNDDVRANLWDLRKGGTMTGDVRPPQPASADAMTERPEQTSFVGNFAQHFDPRAIAHGLATMGRAYFAQDPAAHMELAQPHIDQFQKARASLQQGRTSDAVGHGIAAAVPLIGPAAAQAGEQIGRGDVTGGLGNAAGQVVMAALPGLAVRGARRAVPTTASNVETMNQALGATTRENKVRSARVAPEMLRRRVWNKDLPTLEARAAAESETAGQAVGAEVASVADRPVNVLPLVEQMEALKEPYIGRAMDGRRIVNDAGPVEAIERLQNTLMEYGDQVSLGSLNKLRQNWDEIVQRGKGFTTDDVSRLSTWAAREGRSILRQELGQATPDMNRLMAEYSFWQNIEDVAHATNVRRVGQSRGLLPAIAGWTGAAVTEAALSATGAGLTTKAGGVLVGAKTAASLKRLLDSPGYQMWSAVQKQRLADALASRNAGRIEAAVGRGLAFVASQTGRMATATARSDESQEDRTAPQAQR
jgi:hypothetical protein